MRQAMPEAESDPQMTNASDAVSEHDSGTRRAAAKAREIPQTQQLDSRHSQTFCRNASAASVFTKTLCIQSIPGSIPGSHSTKDTRSLKRAILHCEDYS